jgi:REDY-like protein HapK
MTTLIVLFNLKPGVNLADYEMWARSVDVPTVKALRSIEDFRVFRASGVLGSEAASPYQYIEVVEVNDMPLFFQEITTETLKNIAATFQGFADAPTFIITEQFA